MVEINPGNYEEEFLNWLNTSYQGSDKRRFRYYTEEIFRQGQEENFKIDTEDVEESMAKMKYLIRNDLDYSLWPPVSYAYQKLLDYLKERFPREEDSLEPIREGIAPSEFDEMDEHDYYNKSMQERAKERRKQLIDKNILEEVFSDVSWEREVILRTLYDTACRRGEFIAIKVKDLKFDTKIAPVTIELKRQGKQNNDGKFVVEDSLKIRENRLVYAEETTAELLRKQIEEKELGEDDFLFFPDVKRSTAYGKLKKIVVESFEGYSKPEDLTPHNFRHTRATDIVKEFSLYDAKEYLGHEEITSTEVYTHIDVENDIIRKISGNRSQEIQQKVSKSGIEKNRSPMDRLNHKLVEDEITEEEYKRKKDLIQG